ncbi:LOW QUALITY PROTEIN: coiled-coil domain-containing protein 22 [Dermochelys coriacea]|uniref:LOW QUALITY PROTEIN: coiled-coil domain-containing protein 22 n=1 Tax=Dermochelys coriacea TaxID=27794 RepID=UPI0018E706EC|nr:LOW QUALITY PROTEIN: coiled-coil domain-containing protein 22 [Dermochelys coriacea]
MEEVDKILIRSLRLSGTQVPEEVQSLREFTTELIVESVVRCLHVIHPSLGASLGHVLPPGMSARFRIGTSLAQACQELGYQGEVGYQTFLYSNEPEIRRLLLFLVEKLPRDDAEDARQPAGKSAGLLRAIAAKIKEQLGTPWVPPMCRTPRLQLLQGTCLLKPFHAHPLVLPRNSGPVERREFFGGFLPLVPAQPPQPGAVAPSLLERHAGDLGAQHDWEADWQSQGLASRLPPKEYVQWKHQRLQRRLLDQLRQAPPPHGTTGPPQPGAPDLAQMLGLLSAGGTGGPLAKGSRFSHAQRLAHEQDPQELVGQMQAAVETLPSSKTSEQEELARQAEELAGLQGELRRLEAEMEAVGGEVKVLELSLCQAAAGLCQQRLAQGGRERTLLVKRRALELLPQAERNLAALRLLVEGSARRLVHLAAQWETHRGPLVDQYRHLRAARRSRQLESTRRVSEIQALHERSRSVAAEARRKEELCRQLLSELESLPKDVSRAAYTQRILEIVGNIRKQKEEITKILSDTRALQKEINGLTGKLDRTFAVTDELVFKDAKRDESVRKAYKYLAALHENCSQLIQTIEDAGAIQREIRDLEEQIESEGAKKTLANLERILSDYQALRQENTALLGRSRDP